MGVVMARRMQGPRSAGASGIRLYAAAYSSKELRCIAALAALYLVPVTIEGWDTLPGAEQQRLEALGQGFIRHR